jgi:Zn-dependent protease with chaperone function
VAGRREGEVRETLMERLDRERRRRRIAWALLGASLVFAVGAPLYVAVAQVSGGGCILGAVFPLAVGGAFAGFGWLLLRNPDVRATVRALCAVPMPPEIGAPREALADMVLAFGVHPPPALYLLETPALNAFAVGRLEQGAAVGVTRGMAEALSRDELRAVFAHLFARLLLGLAPRHENDPELPEQADALALSSLRDPRALLSALERLRGADTYLEHSRAWSTPLFFAPAEPPEPGSHTLSQRIAHLCEVLGAEGLR